MKVVLSKVLLTIRKRVLLQEQIMVNPTILVKVIQQTVLVQASIILQLRYLCVKYL